MNPYRLIPKMENILLHKSIPKNCSIHKEAAQIVLDDIRENISKGITDVPLTDEIISMVLEKAAKLSKPSIQRVINGTGIILHTNLGRAPLPCAAIEAVNMAAKSYTNLEFDIQSGNRGSRHSHTEKLLTELTGAESAMAVNNNAAAVLLTLAALTQNKEVIVSRGELVEIGGSFRIPKILEQSGAKMVEVGTTNKTHLYDYEENINLNTTAAILKVHTSNFFISGFTSTPSLEELSKLTKKHRILLIEDLGSGSLVQISDGFNYQFTVADSIKSGCDVVTFSGDKLLGGPQAGIIVGKKSLVEKIKKHPLARALRIDKLSLAALEATLLLYKDPKNVKSKIPTLQMITISFDELSKKTHKLLDLLTRDDFTISILNTDGKTGGGALPSELIKSCAVSIVSDKYSADFIEKHFRTNTIPIIGRIYRDQFLLDVRTIEEFDFILIKERLFEL